MESALTVRDKIGVEDFVLLEDYRSEDAFMENLRKRFKEKLIYVRPISNNNYWMYPSPDIYWFSPCIS